MIYVLGGGGANLNFRVLGGTSTPTNPKENDIWVNTDTAISEWTFLAEQPENSVEGMVWFQTGINSAVAFSVLKSKQIRVYPTGCKQYVSGAWLSKTAKIYQGGTWVEWWTGELFMNGNQYPIQTGGWKIVNAGVGTGVIKADSIFLGYSGSSGRESAAFTVNKVNVTEFSKLCAKVQVTSGSNFYIGLCDTNTKSLPTYAYSKKASGTGEAVMECDISSALGEYYIGANADISNGYIYEFYLQK